MSSNFAKSAFVSGLLALPVPLILPYALASAAGDNPFSGVLGSDYATSYYVITWALVTMVGVLTALFTGGQASPAVSGRSKDNKAAYTSKASDNDNDASGPEGEENGTVKWFNVNKGFGFITTEAGEDIFVHFRSIRGRGRRSLKQGQSVRFDISEGDKGLQADNVSVIGD